MKVLVLNGLNPDQKESLRFKDIVSKSFEFSGFDYEIIDLHSKKINKCKGCFDCWVRTPGECYHKDESQAINKLIINSDLLVYITPIVYGGYSSHLKKMLDKTIPLISPFFKRYGGEVHHVSRYEKYPRLLALGIQSYANKEEEACFKQLVYRNSLNFHIPCHSLVFLQSDEENYIYNKLDEIILETEDLYHAK